MNTVIVDRVRVRLIEFTEQYMTYLLNSTRHPRLKCMTPNPPTEHENGHGLYHGQEGTLLKLSGSVKRLERHRHFFDRPQKGRLMRVLFRRSLSKSRNLNVGYLLLLGC
jgi:hypothetical protein